ncbi:peptidoglycan-associated lipoprotein [Endomicrobiia bacterium]|nr:peptidoglycan-associated lipoprotein [Endomicrobiia bacterium]
MKKGLLLMFVGVFVFVAGCKTQDVESPDSAAEAIAPTSEPSAKGDSDVSTNLKTVYFDFDKSDLTSDALETLKENAKRLKDNSELTVIIEGHTDNRGTAEYNLSLGQRRATKVKEYYVQLGVAGDRIKTISYGREKPADTDNNESAWSRNRRAETKKSTN